MDLDNYEHLGDPDQELVPSRQYDQKQAEAERMHESVRRLVKGSPPLSDETIAKVRSILSYRTPPHELMRWRLRLHCGHVVETAAHRDHTMVHSAVGWSRHCPECGADPSAILAARPVGLAGPPPDMRETRVEPRPLTRAQLERRVRELESRVAELSRPAPRPAGAPVNLEETP